MGFGSVLGKIAKFALPIAGGLAIPGVGHVVGGALGKVLGSQGGVGKNPSGILGALSSPLGQLGVKTGLGVLGSTLNANAYNQPEKWRQGIIENELVRRNQLQSAAAPTLAGMLGYRTPEMGQQLQATLGSKKVKK